MSKLVMLLFLCVALLGGSALAKPQVLVDSYGYYAAPAYYSAPLAYSYPYTYSYPYSYVYY